MALLQWIIVVFSMIGHCVIKNLFDFLSVKNAVKSGGVFKTEYFLGIVLEIFELAKIVLKNFVSFAVVV